MFSVIEKRGKAGGHWNDAYPFVSLQQPSAWYGVNSRILGSGGQDMVSKAKILAYYEDVVDSLLASGRVKFFWQSEYKGDGKFISMAKGSQEYQVRLIMNISVANITRNPFVPSSKQSSQLHISISILKTLLTTFDNHPHHHLHQINF